MTVYIKPATLKSHIWENSRPFGQTDSPYEYKRKYEELNLPDDFLFKSFGRCYSGNCTGTIKRSKNIDIRRAYGEYSRFQRDSSLLLIFVFYFFTFLLFYFFVSLFYNYSVAAECYLSGYPPEPELLFDSTKSNQKWPEGAAAPSDYPAARRSLRAAGAQVLTPTPSIWNYALF